MPIVAHSNLPSFIKLQKNGQDILPLDQALSQDIRELHIGLLNMMPDAALKVTEQQFIRLVGNCNKIVQFYIHPFSIKGLPRSPETQAYVDEYYDDFESLKAEGLDALIITGANPVMLEDQSFWASLQEVIGWAQENVTSTLCSCMATHALVKHIHQLDRKPLPDKYWGVFQHRIVMPKHPLLWDINTRFDVPHSRWNEVSSEQFEEAGLPIIVASEDVGVHIATSPDLFRIIYFQGHPEYDVNSLLKEYKREVFSYLAGSRTKPPFPTRYFSAEVEGIAFRYLADAETAIENGEEIPPFPEQAMAQFLDNTWGDTAKAIFNNWLGRVYQLTHVDRTIPFKEGIDPNDPLGILKK